MSSSGSVTGYVNQLRAGDQVAAKELWDRYFRRLVGLARTCLRGRPRRAADEEDVALSAFDTFCRAAQGGRFPEALDRNNLWLLLVVITERKALRQVAYDGAQKRGGGRPPDPDLVLEQVLSREPTPAFAAEVVEECQRLLDGLGDDQLREVAVWKMEGCTTDEIAARLGRSPRTVERYLRAIRRVLETRAGPGWREGDR